MQIFILDSDPRKSAQMHCDNHVNKMTTEACQILASCFYLSIGITKKSQRIGREEEIAALFSGFPRTKDGVTHPYGPGYLHHPCTVWAFTCVENFMWLINFARELSTEYTYRYERTHACAAIIDWMESNAPQLASLGSMTPFARTITNKQIDAAIPDTLAAYRAFYLYDKRKFAKWKKAPHRTPDWWWRRPSQILSPQNLKPECQSRDI